MYMLVVQAHGSELFFDIHADKLAPLWRVPVPDVRRQRLCLGDSTTPENNSFDVPKSGTRPWFGDLSEKYSSGYL